MSRVEIRYLLKDKTFRIRKLGMRSKNPNHLSNVRDGQCHLITGGIFPKGKPKRFKTWAEFVEAEPPPSPIYPSKFLSVIEEDSFWPYSDAISKSYPEKLADFNLNYQESYQKASANASVTQFANALGSAGYLITAAIAALMAIGIVFVFVTKTAGKTETPEELGFSIIGLVFLGLLRHLKNDAPSFEDESGVALSSNTAALPPGESPSAPDPVPGYPGWARLYVYDDLKPWEAQIPLSEGLRYLPDGPQGCCYWPNVQKYRFIGAVGGGFFLASFFYFILSIVNQFAPFIHPLALPAVVLPLSLPIGALAGYAWGHNISGGPFFIVRRIFLEPDSPLALELMWQNNSAFYADRDGLRRYVIPYTTTFLIDDLADAWNIPAAANYTQKPDWDSAPIAGESNAKSTSSALPNRKAPINFSAATAYEDRKMLDERNFLRGPMGRGEIVKIASMATLAIVTTIVLVFMFALLQGG